MAFVSTYCLRVIETWLTEHDCKFKYSSSQVGIPYESGLQINLPGDFALSVQTHPLITGYHFAQTTLIYKDKEVCTEGFMYFKSNFYLNPEALFEHIEELKQRLSAYTTHDDEEFTLKDSTSFKIIDLASLIQKRRSIDLSHNK